MINIKQNDLQLSALDSNTWNHLTMCKQLITYE